MKILICYYGISYNICKTYKILLTRIRRNFGFKREEIFLREEVIEREYIIESKKRCRELGINKDKVITPKNIMSKLDLDKKKEEYKEILEVVRFFGEKIIKSLEGTPILIAVSDENGYLLDTLGDKSIELTVNKLGIKEGAQFKEEDVGTNAISLALKQNHPVELIGEDHYHTYLHNIACYGVPFHYSDDNNLLGVICIMTGKVVHNPFFLMTLTTVVDAIERELLLRKQNRKIRMQQELLYQAEKKQREILEKDINMKDQFITMISHEFKTPINVIYSAIQLIEHSYINEIPSRVSSIINSIKRNSFRQLRLINNIIDITKLNANEVNLNYKEVDIIAFSKLIVETVRIYTDKKNINLTLESNLISKKVIIDYEKYERIILNILSNSIKFTNEGGSIVFRINENKVNNTLVIEIIDTGIGIPEEKYKTIFDTFGQVENNLSRKAEGSGLGLSIVRMLVEILGGKISVESKVGVGSNFKIIFPIKEGIVSKEDKINVKINMNSQNKLINSTEMELSDIYF